MCNIDTIDISIESINVHDMSIEAENDSCVACNSNTHKCICKTRVENGNTSEALYVHHIQDTIVGSERRCGANKTILENSQNESTNDPLFDTIREARLKNPKSLIISHVNINSLKKEYKAPIDYFKDILMKHYIDVLCVSETKLDETIVEKDLDCSPSFKFYRKDKTSNSGGLCAWIRSDIPQQRMHELEFDSEVYHIESLIFELIIKKQKWYLIVAYKNPTVSNELFLNKVTHVYASLLNVGKEIILLGDLNIDMLCCENPLKNELCNVYDLSNLISEPTCFKKPEGTLLDPIIVRNRRRFQKSINVFCGYSDHHNLVGCITKLNLPPQKPRKVIYRSLKNFDQNVFKEEVSRIPFHVSNIFNDVDDQYWARKWLFTNVLNEHAPIKERAIKEDHVPYMHSDLRKQMYNRNMLKNKHKKDRKNYGKWHSFVYQRNKSTSMRRSAIKDYILSKCRPGASQKDFWDIVGPFMANKSKSQRNIILREDDSIISDQSELCELFSVFFATSASEIGQPDVIDMSEKDFLYNIVDRHKDHKSILAIKNNHKDLSIFDFKPVDATYVEKILDKLKINKATGYDQIPPKIVKMCSSELSVTLMELVNHAFKGKRFPHDMKKAEISPIFKKNDDMTKNNYRPVSILAVFAKVFETIITNQLTDYFKYIFNDMLCAYRKRYGCEHVLIKLIDSWKYALDENMFAGTVLIDLSKAFDCIPHGLLIAKMRAYGLSKDACEFMSSYLSDRCQRVKISNSKSSWTPITKGIPQGSGLGPILLNVFMNDIFHFMEICDLVNYADDNTLSIIRNTIQLVLSALKKDAENAMTWFKDNFMQANPEKFQFMLMKKYTCKETFPEFIEISGINVQRENEVKLLGITIDEKLRFDMHVDILCKKAARQVNIMHRFKGIFDQKERELVYNTFILSNFNYCPMVWHFCGKVSSKKIERIQERALRFMLNDKTSTYETLLEKCNYTTLLIRRIKVIAIEVFKSLNNLNPCFMNEMFDVKDIPYNLRDTNIVLQPKFDKITYGKNTFKYYGSHIWNLLPNDCKKTTNIEIFKGILKKWEGPRCQCTMCEYLS